MISLTAIAFSLVSYHMPYDNQNQLNPGFHIEAENYRGGIYRNSNFDNGLSNFTVYMGYSLPLLSGAVVGVPYRLGLNAALNYGYNSPVVGGLELRAGEHIVLMGAPRVGAMSGMLALGVRFPF